MSTKPERALKAISRQGLRVHKEGPVYKVSRDHYPEAPAARVLLPEGFELDGKALAQLCAFAGTTHPAGGRVCHACATPDVHAGSLVRVGADRVVVNPFG
jgi:tRNA-splicing ligase RtcB